MIVKINKAERPGSLRVGGDGIMAGEQRHADDHDHGNESDTQGLRQVLMTGTVDGQQNIGGDKAPDGYDVGQL